MQRGLVELEDVGFLLLLHVGLVVHGELLIHLLDGLRQLVSQVQSRALAKIKVKVFVAILENV